MQFLNFSLISSLINFEKSFQRYRAILTFTLLNSNLFDVFLFYDPSSLYIQNNLIVFSFYFFCSWIIFQSSKKKVLSFPPESFKNFCFDCWELFVKAFKTQIDEFSSPCEQFETANEVSASMFTNDRDFVDPFVLRKTDIYKYLIHSIIIACTLKLFFEP